MISLDATDQALLAVLRQDARLPVVDIARRLGVSRATVQNRMKRLEKSGVVLGYTVSVRPEVQPHPVRALMSIAVGSREERAVIDKLRGIPSVVAVHHTTGRWDLIAEIRTDTLANFNAIVGEVRQLDGIKGTETNLLLDSVGTPD
jgi:DNA-binding Lrp family transcriptional regulator